MSAEVTLDGSGQGVDLPMGFTLYAGGFRGTGWALELNDFDSSTRSGGAWDDGSELLNEALDRAGMRLDQSISLAVIQETADTDVRGATYGEAMVLVAPDLGSDYGQVAIVVDEDGAVSFHFPVEDLTDQETQPAGTRGAGGEKVFVLRAAVPESMPDGEDDGTRGLIGALGRKLIKVVAFPLATAAVRAARGALQAWEESSRGHRLRRFTPGDFRTRTEGTWSGDDWRAMSGSPALLFVHGTFSTAHGGFGGIPPQLIQAMHTTYGGRVFAFEHPSITVGPDENVRWLLDRLPSGGSLEVDVVCHSRGGLVGRVLAGELEGLDTGRIRVRRVVFVGTPNNGTPLADSEHLGVLLDRMATIANLFPGVPAAEIFDAVLAVVKVVAHGVLTGLDGLAAMRPGGDFLNRLNAGGPTEATYYGISSNFEPTRPGLKRLLQGAQDTFIDFVFQDAANDLVVPTLGVSAGFESRAFPLEGDRVLSFEGNAGITHSTYWSHPATAEAFTNWLTG